ncbi:hypothetical protein OS493_033306 [Desmophyllum pertusum]|uniref:Uncharacterized protein n=1 Tax=Desmophyllum pertusum TaxID=174260 RepID=A0A9W9Z950_9CNID|nr:hypothetical protein OS493_033306 [Desmophyllum pertusum]
MDAIQKAEHQEQYDTCHFSLEEQQDQIERSLFFLDDEPGEEKEVTPSPWEKTVVMPAACQPLQRQAAAQEQQAGIPQIQTIQSEPNNWAGNVMIQPLSEYQAAAHVQQACSPKITILQNEPNNWAGNVMIQPLSEYQAAAHVQQACSPKITILQNLCLNTKLQPMYNKPALQISQFFKAFAMAAAQEQQPGAPQIIILTAFAIPSCGPRTTAPSRNRNNSKPPLQYQAVAQEEQGAPTIITTFIQSEPHSWVGNVNMIQPVLQYQAATQAATQEKQPGAPKILLLSEPNNWAGNVNMIQPLPEYQAAAYVQQACSPKIKILQSLCLNTKLQSMNIKPALQRSKFFKSKLRKMSQSLPECQATVHQDGPRIETLKREAMEALANETAVTHALDIKLRQEHDLVTGERIRMRHYKGEAVKFKKEQEFAVGQIKKYEEERDHAQEMYDAIENRGLQTQGHAEQRKTESHEQTISELNSVVTELNKNVTGLQAENVAFDKKNQNQHIELENRATQIGNLGDCLETLESTRDELTAENAAIQSKLNDSKKCSKKATKKLDKARQDLASMNQRLKKSIAKGIKRGRIIEADKEEKAEMKATIETLEEENETLHHKLNSGFVGKYRAVKRFFGRLVDALKSL